MSINMMEMIKGAVADQVMGQIGGLLGQDDPKKTSSIFETAAATILGGLMNKAGSREGTQQVFEAAQNADDSILEKLGDILGGDGPDDQYQQRGGGVLDMVFGDQQGSIFDSLAKALGIDGTLIGKLLAVVAPIVMSVISRRIKEKALDMVGLGSLLGEQKQHLGSYLPASLTNDLGFGNLLGDASAAGRQAVGQVGDAAHAAADQGGSLAKLLIPLLILGAIAIGAWKLFGGPATDAVNKAADGAKNMVADAQNAVTEGMSSVPKLDFSGLDLSALGETGTKLQSEFTGITEGFRNLTDEASANTLKDKMSGLTGSLENMGLGDLSGVAKTTASTMIEKFIETVQSLLDKVENPTLKGILQPAADSLLAKLREFAA